MWLDFYILTMDKIIFVVPDPDLRQLYHELLFSEKIEIIPLDILTDAIILLVLTEVKLLIIYVDDNNLALANAVFHIRSKNLRLMKTKLVVVSPIDKEALKFLSNQDQLISPLHYNPEEIVKQIKASLML